MARYWRVYRTFFLSSLTRELEFKANFFARVLQNVVWTLYFIAVLIVIYSNTNSVAGWDRGDGVVLMATMFLMDAIAGAFFMSLIEVPEQVRRGTLDFVITKPIDTQFWVSTRRFNLNQIGTMLVGCGMVGIGLWLGGAVPSPMQWLAYGLGMIASLALFYSFNLFLMTLGIWLVRVDNLWVLSETVTLLARFPMEIYGPVAQRFLTWVVPLAFLSFIPAQQLVKGLDFVGLGVGLLWGLGALIMTRAFWRFALRSYTSASS